MIKQLSYKGGAIPQNWIDLWEHLYQIGDQYYDSIKPVIKDFSQVAQLPILSSAYIYHGLVTSSLYLLNLIIHRHQINY